MTSALKELAWGEPLLPHVTDLAWEKEVRKVHGTVPDIFKRVSRSEWLRSAILKWPLYKPREFPEKLAHISTLVAAQENACRYCLGVARSQMKLLGYPENFISGIERDLLLAELDLKERAFVRFCRNLSRSAPRPPRQDTRKLVQLGFSEKAVAEIVFVIANDCFMNRVSTFLAIPPEKHLENISNSFIGKILRPLMAKKMRRRILAPDPGYHENMGEIPGVVEVLSDLPAAQLLNEAYQGAIAPSAISQELKVFMFAVVARSLACNYCENESRLLADKIGIKESDYERALQTLDSDLLDPQEKQLLDWTRETVHYQTVPVQKSVRELLNVVDEVALLETIGFASLANSIVRMAILLDR